MGELTEPLMAAPKPKSKAERFNLSGGVPLNASSPAPPPASPPTDNHSQEPQHTEDQDIFEGEGHDCIPVRLPDDELGPLPPIPHGVSSSIVDSINELDILPGVREIRSLIKQVLERAQGDSAVKVEIAALLTDCEALVNFIENLDSTVPEINQEVTRMRKELTNTLAHLNHHVNSPAARLRSRIAVLEQTERCCKAYQRIQLKFLVAQGAEIRNTQQQLLAQQTRPPSSELQGEIQASEEKLQQLIRQLTGRTIPQEMILSERIKYRWAATYSDGKRFNVHKGELMNGDMVAIKISTQKPGFDGEGKNLGRRVRRHATIWKSFNNKYILPFNGMGVEIIEVQENRNLDHYRIYFVSPWIPDGDAVTYIRSVRRRDLYVDVAKIVRDAALGLKYLHQMEEPCIHGSVRGENILIKMDGGVEQGCLNGFALTKKEIRNQPKPEFTGNDGSPEILTSASDTPPLEPSSDIWSWAMTALELYSGLEPYHQYKKDPVICAQITSGQPPARKDYPDFDKYAPLPDKTWALLERCWEKEPEKRPTIQDIVDELDRIDAEFKLVSSD